jgi:glutaredoxin
VLLPIGRPALLLSLSPQNAGDKNKDKAAAQSADFVIILYTSIYNSLSEKRQAKKIPCQTGRRSYMIHASKGENMKKLLIAASAIALFACDSGSSNASDIKLFYMPGCPHCHNAIAYLDSELKDVSVEKIDITTKDQKNYRRFEKQVEKCKLTSRGVPVIVVKGECLQGWGPEQGPAIKQKLGK